MKKTLQTNLEKVLLEIIKLKDIPKLDATITFLNEAFDEEEVATVMKCTSELLFAKFPDLHSWFEKEIKTYIDIQDSLANIGHLFLDQGYQPGVDFLMNEEGLIVTEEVYKILLDYYPEALLDEFVSIGVFIA